MPAFILHAAAEFPTGCYLHLDYLKYLLNHITNEEVVELGAGIFISLSPLEAKEPILVYLWILRQDSPMLMCALKTQ